MEQEFQPTPGTQSIDRGAQLLTLVLESDAPRGLGELAADAGLPKSTASRLLGALERNGLVEQEGLRGAFRAGPVMARFAGRGISARRLIEAAERPMAALADATAETINVAVAGPGGVEHLAQVETTHYLGTSHWVGRRVPYHCSANGKVLLAFAAAGARAGPARGADVAHDRGAGAARRRAGARSAATASPPRSTSSSWASARSPRRCSTSPAARSPRSASPARRCGSRRGGWPSSVPSSSSRPGRSGSSSATVPRECTPHDARRDPHDALRRDARRERARGEGRRQRRASRRAWIPARCSTTR